MKIHEVLLLVGFTASSLAQAELALPSDQVSPPVRLVVPAPRDTVPPTNPVTRSDNTTLPSTPSLVVSLVDGSRLNGTTTLKTLNLRSEALGQLILALEKISSLKFDKNDESVTIILQNGDCIRAGFDDLNLPLVTLFGPVTVPIDKVGRIQMQPAGVKTIEWEMQPWMRDTDWPGSRGQPARIEGETIELRGRALRSKQAFSGPVTIEADFSVQQIDHHERAMVRLVPEGTPLDTYGPPGTVVAMLLQYENGHKGGRLYVQPANGSLVDVTPAPFVLGDGERCQIRIEVSADTVRLSIGGQPAKPVQVVLPESFHMQICGWKPDRVWRVQNLSVR